MNLNQAYGLSDVKELIGSVSDASNTQLRVTLQGDAFISTTDVGNSNTEGLAFRLETWDAGNDYVGAAAAQDEEWCNRILKVLQSNWPKPTSSYIDVF